MKQLARILPIILAVTLQIMPLVRNVLISPATGSSFAFILRWGIGSAAVVGAYDSCSGASNFFTNTDTFIGTVGVPFTNNLALKSTGTDGGAYTIISSNNVSVALTLSGQTTNFAMPSGLSIRFLDDKSTANPVHDAIFGTPTTTATNTFSVSLIYQSQIISTNITIKILAATGFAPFITNHPSGLTSVAGGTATFNVLAGPPPLFYQWKYNTNTLLPNATNATLTLTNLRTSQAGTYSVTVTNSSGSTNSFQASLVVTNPLPPVASLPAVNNGGMFQFTFTPVPGLTNTILTTSAMDSGNWAVLTNIPPPANAVPITVTDPMGSANRFYRVQIIP